MSVAISKKIIEELTIVGPCSEANPIIMQYYADGFRLNRAHVREDGSEICEYVIEREMAAHSGGEG